VRHTESILRRTESGCGNRTHHHCAMRFDLGQCLARPDRHKGRERDLPIHRVRRSAVFPSPEWGALVFRRASFFAL